MLTKYSIGYRKFAISQSATIPQKCTHATSHPKKKTTTRKQEERIEKTQQIDKQIRSFQEIKDNIMKETVSDFKDESIANKIKLLEERSVQIEKRVFSLQEFIAFAYCRKHEKEAKRMELAFYMDLSFTNSMHTNNLKKYVEMKSKIEEMDCNNAKKYLLEETEKVEIQLKKKSERRENNLKKFQKTTLKKLYYHVKIAELTNMETQANSWYEVCKKIHTEFETVQKARETKSIGQDFDFPFIDED